MEPTETEQTKVKANGTKPNKTAVSRTAPPATFPLAPEVWRRYVANGIQDDYGLSIEDIGGRFQDDWLVLSYQPVSK